MDDVLARLLLVAALLAAIGIAGWWWRRRDGRIQAVESDDDAPPAFDDAQLAEVGLSLDGGAGAVLLSSPTCGSCVQVQRILTEVTERRPDFAWVTVDAGEHLDLARRHHVLRVPTLFVVDAGGHLLARTSGIPARHELEQLLEEGVGQRAR
jgi:glutaredoxin